MSDSPTPTPILSGQEIGVAARATRAVLDAVLRDAGTTFPTWVALNQVGSNGASVPREALQRNLAEGLAMDPGAVAGLLDEMAEAGLLQGTASVQLSPQGRARYEGLRDAIGTAGARLWAGFDPDDLVTTRRVLLEVTERARAQS